MPHPLCLVAATAAALFLPCAADAADTRFGSERHDFRVSTIVKGLDHPWSLAFLPDGRLLVTERSGRLRVVDRGNLDPRPVSGVPAVAASGQGGLLDVLPHPDFSSNGLVYLSYAAADSSGASTAVARGRLDGHRLADVVTIFEARPKTSGGRHFGSRLAWGGDGKLYVTLGDRGLKFPAQYLGHHAGSVLRLEADGGVPTDNPFAGRRGARPEIFTYGHRNAQGMAVHPDTGKVWVHEHGPRGGDEVNVLRPGANYGWPVVTYGVGYDGSVIGSGTEKAGTVQPITYWVPSIAPSGMAFYTGAAFPKWRGNLFVGALRGQLLARLELDGERVVHEERLLVGAVGRIRDVRQGPDGYLYLLIDSGNAPLLRLEPVE